MQCSKRRGTDALFDHLVSDRKELGGDVDLERSCGLQIDHEFELGRPIDRQVCRLRSIEDAADIDSSPAIVVRRIVAIADQATDRYELTIGMNDRNGIRAALISHPVHSRTTIWTLTITSLQ
jgi:hypothetical protein